MNEAKQLYKMYVNGRTAESIIATAHEIQAHFTDASCQEPIDGVGEKLWKLLGGREETYERLILMVILMLNEIGYGEYCPAISKRVGSLSVEKCEWTKEIVKTIHPQMEEFYKKDCDNLLKGLNEVIEEKSRGNKVVEEKSKWWQTRKKHKSSEKITEPSEASILTKRVHLDNNITLFDQAVYMQDISGTEEIKFQTNETLRKANADQNLDELISINKSSPSSSDPACLLAQALISQGQVDAAEQTLLDALRTVKLKSHVAASLGMLYLFDKINLPMSLKWFMRSIIAQRNKPYLETPYIYMYGFLTVLSRRWISFKKEADRCKSIADKLAGYGGIELNHLVLRDIDVGLSELPAELVQSISYDLQNIFKSIKLF